MCTTGVAIVVNDRVFQLKLLGGLFDYIIHITLLASSVTWRSRVLVRFCRIIIFQSCVWSASNWRNMQWRLQEIGVMRVREGAVLFGRKWVFWRLGE